QREPGLLLAGHDANPAARRGLDARDELAAVRRVADRAGGDDRDVRRAGTLGGGDELGDGLDRATHGRFHETAGARLPLTEPGHPLGFGEDAPAGADRLDDQ